MVKLEPPPPPTPLSRVDRANKHRSGHRNHRCQCCWRCGHQQVRRGRRCSPWRWFVFLNMSLVTQRNQRDVEKCVTRLSKTLVWREFSDGIASCFSIYNMYRTKWYRFEGCKCMSACRVSISRDHILYSCSRWHETLLFIVSRICSCSYEYEY